MSKESRGIPYRWILPLVQLLICAIILWPVRNRRPFSPAVTYQFEFSTGVPAQMSAKDGHLDLNLELKDPKLERLEKHTNFRLATPVLLDLPVMLVVLPYAILSRTKNDWAPKGMEVKVWRAVSWPFVGLIFWWLAGLSIEALFSARDGVINPSVGWLKGVVGSLVLALGVLFVLIPFCGGIEGGYFPVAFAGLAGAVWMVLGSTTVAACIAQRRIRLRLGANKTAADLPS